LIHQRKETKAQQHGLPSWTRSGVSTSYAYDARGNLTSITGPSGTTSFTVDPATGRFLTKDSYPPDLLAPLTQNPYQYCENNPVNRVDPEVTDSKLLVTQYEEHIQLGSSANFKMASSLYQDIDPESNEILHSYETVDLQHWDGKKYVSIGTLIWDPASQNWFDPGQS
jgi:RHS repeat-associated protein